MSLDGKNRSDACMSKDVSPWVEECSPCLHLSAMLGSSSAEPLASFDHY
jgi:hypothetical protein